MNNATAATNNTHQFIYEEYVCGKDIRDEHGRIDSRLCAQRAEYFFFIDGVEVEEPVFKKKLINREGNKINPKIIIKTLKKRADKMAKRRFEPCECCYVVEYDHYNPDGIGEEVEYVNERKRR
ncbi:MAG: hypothetical protein LBI56_01040 [Puniceicoccales bacterium]|jgi:hypothetical protein|nr:hypothetical protein [Puniceicoccales bacterium]